MCNWKFLKFPITQKSFTGCMRFCRGIVAKMSCGWIENEVTDKFYLEWAYENDYFDMNDEMKEKAEAILKDLEEVKKYLQRVDM